MLYVCYVMIDIDMTCSYTYIIYIHDFVLGPTKTCSGWTICSRSEHIIVDCGQLVRLLFGLDPRLWPTMHPAVSDYQPDHWSQLKQDVAHDLIDTLSLCNTNCEAFLRCR